MTKQHFIALADSIRADGTFTPEQIHALADFCAAQNPAFNRSRWLAYVAGECGPEGASARPEPSTVRPFVHAIVTR